MIDLFGLFRKRKTKFAKIVTLGTSGAGKTTFIRYLETGRKVEDTEVTLGVDIRNKGAKIGNWFLSTIDVGGQDLYKNALWGLTVTQADGIVYVIDGTIRKDKNPLAFKKSKLSFEYMLNLSNSAKPVLILINKQDLIELLPYSAEEAVQHYDVKQETRHHPLYVLSGSAKFGQNIINGMEWLMKNINELK